MGIQGSPLERLLWDIAIIDGEKEVRRPRGVVTGKQATQMVGKAGSVASRIKQKRRLMGIDIV